MPKKNKPIDKARSKCDKILSETERRISDVYSDSSSLRRIMRQYRDYMYQVDKKTKSLFDDYQQEQDPELKKEKLNAYKAAVRRYTLGSKAYNQIIKKFTYELANVNQQALDIVNDQVSSLYAISYNQVAEDCKKVGIEVHGKG